jgi:hypothetical protein
MVVVVVVVVVVVNSTIKPHLSRSPSDQTLL